MANIQKHAGLRALSFIFIVLAVVMLSVMFFFPSAHATAPQGLTATYSNGNVTLSWNPVENATLYKIYRGLSSSNESYYANVSGNQTTYIDTNVTEGHTYYYQVSAIVNGNETNRSEEVFITVQNTAGGGGNLDIKQYLRFNSYMLYISLFLLAMGTPLYFFGANRHKDVAKYALLLGVVLLAVAWGSAYFNANIKNITLYNATFNSIFIVVGLLLLFVSIAIYALKERQHEDVAKFSAAFGILLMIFAYLVEHLGL